MKRMIFWPLLFLFLNIPFFTSCSKNDHTDDPPDENDLAFPGADGYGRFTHGGRGGMVYYVTNLKDDNQPGSLRYGLENINKPRIILFKVSGIIELKKYQSGSVNIIIRNPYVTIAGHTAPGDGIVIKNGSILVMTHDVIIRHIRFRAGDSLEGTDPSGRDALMIGGAENVIIDHVSAGWGIDENVSIMAGCKNITIQNCIISEGLYRSLHPEITHSRGMIITSGAKRVSVIKNIFAHNHMRNPLIKGDNESIDFVNNLVYNWGGSDGYATHFSDPELNGPVNGVNIYKNLYIGGSDSNDDPLYRRGAFQLIFDNSEIYIDSNLYDNGNMTGYAKEMSENFSTRYNEYKSFLTDEFHGVEMVSVLNENDVKDYVLENAGCRVPITDDPDERVLNEVKNRTGKIIDSPRDVGGYTDYRSDDPPQDSDNDGIPDEWERSHNLDPFNPADANDTVQYYTHIEMYLNELASEY